MQHASTRFLAATAILALSITHAHAVVIDTLRVPDGGVHPQAQVDAAGKLHLIYVKGDAGHGDLFYVTSGDGGKSFTAPLRVNSQPQSVVIKGTMRGPHITLGREGRVHVAWMGSSVATPKVNGKAAPMLYTRLTDDRKSFELQRNVIQKYPGLDGGGSVAADPEGNVYVVWHAPTSGHAEEDRQVWVARSKDDGTTFELERAAVPKKTGACGCCGLNVTAQSGGRVLIAFRSAHEMVNRDIHLLSSKDYGQSFEIVAVDPWKIGMCVMSTTSFATSKDSVLAAWETQEDIRFARLGDGTAKAVTPTSAPDTGTKQKHPSVAMNSRGEFVVAWTEGTGWNKGGVVRWQGYDRDGRPVKELSGRSEGLPAWGLPSVVATSNDTFKVIY